MAKFDGGYSPDTLASVPRRPIRDVDDLYPDRQATPNADGTFPIRDSGTTTERLDEVVPKTTYDMNKLYTWEQGDIVRGTHAKDNSQMGEYIKDINRSWGAQSAYKHVFIDTFAPIKPQAEKFKNKGRMRKSTRRKSS